MDPLSGFPKFTEAGGSLPVSPNWTMRHAHGRPNTTYSFLRIAFSSGNHQGRSNFMSCRIQTSVKFSETPFTHRLNTESKGNEVIRKTSHNESVTFGNSEL